MNEIKNNIIIKWWSAWFVDRDRSQKTCTNELAKRLKALERRLLLETSLPRGEGFWLPKSYSSSESKMISVAKTEAGAAGGNGGSSMTEKRRPVLPAT